MNLSLCLPISQSNNIRCRHKEITTCFWLGHLVENMIMLRDHVSLNWMLRTFWAIEVIPRTRCFTFLFVIIVASQRHFRILVFCAILSQSTSERAEMETSCFKAVLNSAMVFPRKLLRLWSVEWLPKQVRINQGFMIACCLLNCPVNGVIFFFVCLLVTGYFSKSVRF